MGLFSRKKRATTDDPSVEGIAGTGADEGEGAAAPSPSTDPATASLEEFDALVDREWDRLARPGTWWNGPERVAIAGDARRAVIGAEPSGELPPPVAEAVRRIAAAPAGLRGTDVARWQEEGLDNFAFVETVGVVSRLVAIDVAGFGLGLEPRPLPEPVAGDPSLDKPEDAVITTGWAPTIGPASAPSSLSAVPAEFEAMFDVHGVLYASLEQMFEMQLERDSLSRPQMELVAARTSGLNDCFY